MLPEALLCLLAAVFASAQTLVLNDVVSLNTTSPQSLAIPSGARLAISIALCAATTPAPRFFLSKTEGIWEVTLEDGLGTWTDVFPEGGTLTVNGTAGIPFEVGVSEGAALHSTVVELPVLGDTTSNQALLFSPPFSPLDAPQPTYPNYTLPAANMSQPAPPASTPNYTLALFPTPLTGPHTACFLAKQRPAGRIAERTLWARDAAGWRVQFLVGGLAPASNYTAFVLLDARSVSGPIWFGTKSAAFSCPLVHSLPFCPSVSYAMPLPAPPAPALAHTALTLPANLTAPLLSYLANFTATLTTFACGRDWYSPLVGCADCQREYRAWLCAVSLPRCGELPLISSGTQGGSSQAPIILHPALTPQSPSTTPRNPFLPAFSQPYLALQPCLEQCHRVDRACPPFLGFKCPDAGGGAERSYAVGYVDDGDGGAGTTGASIDRWGGIWCNML